MPNQTLWAGHVEFVLDDEGHKHILYRKDGSVLDQTYTPSGMMENAAVNHLADKLK